MKVVRTTYASLPTYPVASLMHVCACYLRPCRPRRKIQRVFPALQHYLSVELRAIRGTRIAMSPQKVFQLLSDLSRAGPTRVRRGMDPPRSYPPAILSRRLWVVHTVFETTAAFETWEPFGLTMNIISDNNARDVADSTWETDRAARTQTSPSTFYSVARGWQSARDFISQPVADVYSDSGDSPVALSAVNGSILRRHGHCDSGWRPANG